MLVARSLPIAPRKNASLGRTFPRLFSTASFNCSKIVYCKIGLMTRTRAGSTPAKNAVKPSSRKREMIVRRVEGLRGSFEGEGEDWVGRVELVVSAVRAVIRVFITQMGFVIRTVALPAIAPAIMDSTVVSF